LFDSTSSSSSSREYAQAKEDFAIEKARLVQQGKRKIQKDFDQKEKQVEVTRKIAFSNEINQSRLNVLKMREEVCCHFRARFSIFHVNVVTRLRRKKKKKKKKVNQQLPYSPIFFFSKNRLFKRFWVRRLTVWLNGPRMRPRMRPL
jgi:hypothetical protein